jgi:DNA-binding LacI/PurR family transcriptional regulator
VDGLIWLDPRVTPDLVRRFKKQQSMPFVLIQGHLDDPDTTTVATENAQGAYRATKHLLDLGYRRLMLMTGQENNTDSNERMRGAQQALREAGVSVPQEYILNGHHMAWWARKAISEFTESGKPLPEAIFAFNDAMALALLQYFKEKGVRVPEDVALVGFDGIQETEEAQLTTIDTPTREIGTLATRLLIDLIHTPPDQRTGQHIAMSGNLIVRKSCGAHLRSSAAPGTG